MSVSRVLARAFRRERFGSQVNLYIANQVYKKAQSVVTKKDREVPFGFRIREITRNMIENKDNTYYVNDRLIHAAIVVPSWFMLPLMSGLVFDIDFWSDIYWMFPLCSGQILLTLPAISDPHARQIRQLHRIEAKLDQKLVERNKVDELAKLSQKADMILEADPDKFDFNLDKKNHCTCQCNSK